MTGLVDSSMVEKDFMDIVVNPETNEKFHKCKRCGKLFTRNYSLKVHILGHLNIKRFECEICFKRFNSRQYLNDHLNIHSGARPYECPFPNCGQTFKQRAKLSVHRRSAHNDVAKRQRRVLSQPELCGEDAQPTDPLECLLSNFEFPEFFRRASLAYPRGYAPANFQSVMAVNAVAASMVPGMFVNANMGI
eukprot:CAMPEP_0114986004 /NCGR_PEP_ID=MMETSP0216-20121206/8188_1 /TAXON_ID=223996 /ORGANISM="Protocruzia adherens, Strain Boccale" /LENGTH=190 /DNA_ID=CAMNT_0002348397 /DNA_START=232 /DNA_END=804 /DNA_ORIENTATION=+